MDLISNPDETKIVVATDHVDKHRNPKIVEQCSLPLTGARCVSTIITDLVSEQVYKFTSVATAPLTRDCLLTWALLNSAYFKLIERKEASS